MAEEELPYGEVGDLVEELLPIATRLIEAVRDEGPEAIRGVLLRVPTETRAQIDRVPGGIHGVLNIVLAGMVSPDATLGQLLGWTETMDGGPRRARQGSRKEPPAERERQRLVSAGVPADTAMLLAGQQLEATPTTRQRMLHIVHGGRESA